MLSTTEMCIFKQWKDTRRVKVLHWFKTIDRFRNHSNLRGNNHESHNDQELSRLGSVESIAYRQNKFLWNKIPIVHKVPTISCRARLVQAVSVASYFACIREKLVCKYHTMNIQIKKLIESRHKRLSPTLCLLISLKNENKNLDRRNNHFSLD